jgi:hypothetical protein
MRCYGYNIKNNEFIGPGIITNDGCDSEPIDMRVEYFPETDEFLFGCKNNGNGNLYSIGTLSSANIFGYFHSSYEASLLMEVDTAMWTSLLDNTFTIFLIVDL